MTNKKVHFIGIAGSGLSAAAMIAHELGYEVTGCDLQEDSPYLNQLKAHKIKIYKGHDEKHLDNIDTVAATPAVFFQSDNHPEIVKAIKLKKLITWQRFLGKHLLRNKKVFCISGTHGKSTTTAIVSNVFEGAGLDPLVMIGAKVKSWNANFRIGKGSVFVIEADEFYDNFLNYDPDIIILNNIEYDHPDYFSSEEKVIESFRRFIGSLVGDKLLIYNSDSPGVRKVLRKFDKQVLKDINKISYSIKKRTDHVSNKHYFGKITKKDANFTTFETEYSGEIKEFRITLPGDYNVSNALGVIALADHLNIEYSVLSGLLKNFQGIGRRMELIGEKRGIKVYDDYAHHPTAIKNTLLGLKQKFPKYNIRLIIEPHSYSRTKKLLKGYKDAFTGADEVIIAPIYRARDKSNFGINEENIINVANHKNIKYLGDFDSIIKYITDTSERGDVVCVMGAGNSYLISKQIYEDL